MQQFSTPMLATALDYVLTLYYRTQLTSENTYKCYFNQQKDIDSWKKTYLGMNTLHDAIIENKQGNGETIQSNWPMPIIDLSFDRTDNAGSSSNTLRYWAKVENQVAIAKFIAEHGAQVDIDLVVREALSCIQFASDRA